MKPVKPFPLRPLAQALKLLSIAPFLMLSEQAFARIIDGGRPVVIDGSVAPEAYTLLNDAQLTANGANTNEILVQTGSHVSLNGSTVTARGTSDGVRLSQSSADIDRTTITSSGTGLSLLYNLSTGVASQATVTDSTIRGGDRGVGVGSLGQLDLTRTTVVGSGPNGVGIQMGNASVTAQGSTIVGGLYGINMIASGDATQPRNLTLDGTVVQGQSGSAIVVNDFGTPTSAADILIGNGSTLVGGNGVMLEVKGGATANMTADNSHLVGDVTAEAGSTAKVTLENSATLTGRLQNVDTLTLNGQGKWTMVEDSQVTNLAMGGGSVQFGQPGNFYTLSVGNLSGNGNFIMHTDFSTGQTDFINVTGTATGSHTLDIASSGADPLSNKQIHVVHTASGDAAFSLLNGRVDLGTYSYDLLQVGSNDWYLDAASKIISPGTDSVLALFDAARSVWYGELSTLRSRMGEVRMNSGQTGGWMRAYGNRYDVSANSGMAYKQNQQGLSFGVDTPLPSVGDGQWVFGLLGGYSHSNLDMKYGTTGEVDSFYVGSYATWLDADSGYYFDGVVKLNRFQNESDVSLSDGTKAKGSYNTNGLGTTLEFGRHIKLDDGYFVEPYVQAAALTVQGKSYSLDNGMTADGDRSRSLLGTVGSTVGRDIDLGGGQILQPYLKAALVHEFAKGNDVRVNDTVFNNDLSGSRLALGGGASMKVTDKVQMHADLDYSHSSKIKQPWGVNVGVEYKW
ncbi:autotransporter outer membrane beta-barrel domain-containing protein [Pseudomonas batumici]|uniref:Outer membrane autotransporter barrel n=1 Tax=Pseudomonas batumici TaxID=226910 RepID=A0A0C2IHV1_9PSED|nr:autotransporter outer membrane beta-barrel domain-containing protein [Pseudomonas batumici]KIH84482.1 Outer membrane autotransporter barrel [Pseudomonas batumici]